MAGSGTEPPTRGFSEGEHGLAGMPVTAPAGSNEHRFELHKTLQMVGARFELYSGHLIGVPVFTASICGAGPGIARYRDADTVVGDEMIFASSRADARPRAALRRDSASLTPDRYVPDPGDLELEKR